VLPFNGFSGECRLKVKFLSMPAARKVERHHEGGQSLLHGGCDSALVPVTNKTPLRYNCQQ
jgi:hypothetical protein